MPIAGAMQCPAVLSNTFLATGADQNPALNRAVGGRAAGLKTLCIMRRAQLC
jgi:hypothetical protein